MSEFQPRSNSRFDRLVAMLRLQASLGHDVIMDASDVEELLKGLDRAEETLRRKSIWAGKWRDLHHARWIIGDVARDYGFRPCEIKTSDNRKTRAIRARWQAIQRIDAECPHLSTADIAALLDVDPSTVFLALRRMGGMP